MLRRFSIRQVIIGAMAAVGLVAFAGVLTLLMTASSAARELERQSGQLAVDEAIADRIVEHTHRQLDIANRFDGLTDPAGAAEFRREGMAVYDQLRLYLFRELGPEERQLVEHIRELHERIEVQAQHALDGSTAAAFDIETMPAVDSLRAGLRRLIELRREDTAALFEQHQLLWRWLYAAFAGLALAFIAALLAAAVFLRRRLVAPVVRLADAARQVGGGDFGVRVPVSGDDEIAQVGTSFNRMAERLEAARRDTTRAERRFRELLEGLSAVVWESDASTFRCTYVSPQAELMFGYPVAEWLSTDIWRRLIHPDDLDAVLAECIAAAARGDDHRLEYRVVRADGSVLWVRDLVRVLLDGEGRPTRLRGVLTDITAERTATQALRESEERYHSLFDRVPVGLYRTTPDGRFIAANPALLQVLGFERERDVIGMNASELYLNREERTQWQRLLDHAAGVVEVDRQHRHGDGSVVWLRETARAVRNAAGELLYYEGALQDVTERVRAEEAVRGSEARFRSLIENASDGVLILAGDGTITYQSPAVERMLGYAPGETTGDTLFRLVHPDDLELVQEGVRDLMLNSGQQRSIEFRCRHRNGDWRVLHATGTNLLDDSNVGGFVINMIDATAHRQLQTQLQHAHKMEAVGRLAGGIAHDFNNLLTAIQGYTDLLSDRVELKGEAENELGEIRRAADRAAGLTRQLLAFSRRQMVRPRPTELGAVVNELEQMLRRLVTEEVALRTHTAADAWVHADPGQLEQIVMNLVLNARDAQPLSGITVRVQPVTVTAADEVTAEGVDAGEYVMLAVEDDGSGIQPEIMPHIFEPFFTTKEVGKGTGLGLATVYGTVEEYGGHVVVRSTPGAGTQMRVFLPRVARPAAADMPGGAAPVRRRGSESILLVEDEPAVRALAEKVLSRDGYEVITAASGIEALAWLERTGQHIDLLVTDVVMPGMRGVELAERLLQRRPELQVLFISGYSADELPRSDAAGRPLYFLAKPFSPAALTEMIRQILDTVPQPALRS